MPECEFKKLCDSIGYTYPCERMGRDVAYCAVRITLNSPQFKKQYAKRVDTEKAVLDYLANNRYICFNHRVKWEDSEVNAELRKIILKHGLEE